MKDNRNSPPKENRRRMDFFLRKMKKPAENKINKAIIISTPNTKLDTPDFDHREEAARIN